MSKRIFFIVLCLWLTAAAFPAFAQDHADTLHVCPCSANIAAFNLPWLAKYYGLDWKTDSLTAAQSAADSLAKAEAERLSAVKAEDADSYTLSLRANLLRWATLTPDLGLEWRICPSLGIAVNGSWTSWTWSGKDRRYALWEVAPEVRYYMGEKKAWYLGAMFKAGQFNYKLRYYMGEKKAWYLGAMFKAGQFNYKLSETGKQGDLMGGGITAGYQLRLNKALNLDFNLGLGYLNADYEKYEVIDGVRVRRGNGTKDWLGPINAGVTLVWKLF